MFTNCESLIRSMRDCIEVICINIYIYIYVVYVVVVFSDLKCC